MKFFIFLIVFCLSLYFFLRNYYQNNPPAKKDPYEESMHEARTRWESQVPICGNAIGILEYESVYLNNCNACHKIDGHLVGPPLRGIFETNSAEWLQAFLWNPDSLLKSGDSITKNVYANNPNSYHFKKNNNLGYTLAEVEDMMKK